MNTRQRQTREHEPPMIAGHAWRARLGRGWHAFGLGLCFVVYGGLGWLTGMTVLPLLLMWPGSKAARQRRIRRFVGWSFRALMAVLAGLRAGDLEVEGSHWLREADGKLLVANHPMYLDVVALIGLLPQADCVVKQAMWNNLWYRRFVRVIGYIGNASQSGLVRECVERLQDGRSLVLFPEGTRSTPGAPLKFQRGAAQVAVRCGCDILPVVIRCEPLALGKGQHWYDAPARPWRLHVHIFPPRTLAELGWHEGTPHGVAARHVNRALENFFVAELERTGGSHTQGAVAHAPATPGQVDAHA